MIHWQITTRKIVAVSLTRRGFNGQEQRFVCEVPEGYRLVCDYPHSWAWPVRDSIEAALADDVAIRERQHLLSLPNGHPARVAYEEAMR